MSKDKPLDLIGRLPPEQRKKFLEDLTSVSQKHGLPNSTSVPADGPHIFTEADFRHARIGARQVIAGSESGKKNAGKTLPNDLKLAEEFVRLKREGHKPTPAADILAERTGMSTPGVIKAVRRAQQHLQRKK
jgi:hypothetical protein